MICLKLATRTGSFQVEVDATPADCGVANINYERKPLAVPGTRNTGTNYADSRYQLPQIDRTVWRFLRDRRAVLFLDTAITLADVFSAPLTTIENGGHFLGSDGYLDFPQLWQHITQ